MSIYDGDFLTVFLSDLTVFLSDETVFLSELRPETVAAVGLKTAEKEKGKRIKEEPPGANAPAPAGGKGTALRAESERHICG